MSFRKLSERASNVVQAGFRLDTVIKRVKNKKPFCKTIEKRRISKNSSLYFLCVKLIRCTRCCELEDVEGGKRTAPPLKPKGMDAQSHLGRGL